MNNDDKKLPANLPLGWYFAQIVVVRQNNVYRRALAWFPGGVPNIRHYRPYHCKYAPTQYDLDGESSAYNSGRKAGSIVLIHY